MNRRLLHLIVTKSLGCLLLVAAGLKIYGFGATPVGAIGIFSSPSFQVGLIEFEILLGIWLLSGKSPIGSWIVALAGFASFAAVSSYLGWIGQASCGCFGRLSVNPWVAFGLDVVVIAILLVGRPDLKQLSVQSYLKSNLLPMAYGFAGVVVVSALFLALAHYGFGSVPAALAYFRGNRVSVSPGVVDLGEAESGERREFSVELTNWTEKPIHLLGGTTDCSCTVLSNLPVTIQPKETRSVSVILRIAKPPGIFTRTAGFLVDDDGIKAISFTVTGRITGSPSRAE